jgi:selenocysteine lyase/cysteine desulfurase
LRAAATPRQLAAQAFARRAILVDGALAFDVQQIQPDAVICAGYKWLLGPYSTALAYFGPRYDCGEPIEDNWITRKGSEDFQRLIDSEDDYDSGAIRYDGGQRSNFILLPMLIAALQLVLKLTPEGIQHYCERLIQQPIDRARELGFSVEERQWRGSHLFGLRAPEGMDVKRLSRALQARSVAVSLRGSAIRVSPHVYNSEEDLDALIQALGDVS